MAAGASGDPHLERLDGTKFDFHGVAGKVYSLLQTEGLGITIRVRTFDEETTIIDQIAVTTDSHRVVCDTAGVLVDGVPPLELHRRPGDWIWCRRAGDRLVAVGHAGWLVSVFRDTGKEDLHSGGVLEGVEHLAVFVELPGHNFEDRSKVLVVPEGCTGLLADGAEVCDVSKYEVTK